MHACIAPRLTGSINFLQHLRSTLERKTRCTIFILKITYLSMNYSAVCIFLRKLFNKTKVSLAHGNIFSLSHTSTQTMMETNLFSVVALKNNAGYNNIIPIVTNYTDRRTIWKRHAYHVSSQRDGIFLTQNISRC